MSPPSHGRLSHLPEAPGEGPRHRLSVYRDRERTVRRGGLDVRISRQADSTLSNRRPLHIPDSRNSSIGRDSKSGRRHRCGRKGPHYSDDPGRVEVRAPGVLLDVHLASAAHARDLTRIDERFELGLQISAPVEIVFPIDTGNPRLLTCFALTL